MRFVAKPSPAHYECAGIPRYKEDKMLSIVQRREILRAVQTLEKLQPYQKVLAFIHYENSLSFYFKNDSAYYTAALEYFLLSGYPNICERMILRNELRDRDIDFSVVESTLNCKHLILN